MLNEVILEGEVVADPVLRTMPGGDETLELRLACPSSPGARELPLSVVAWHSEVPDQVKQDFFHVGHIRKGEVLTVTGALVRRFYRSGAGARSVTEVRATSIARAGVVEDDGDAEAADDIDARHAARLAEREARR